MPNRRTSNTPSASSAPLVIIGAGVIGTSTAYWLSLQNPNREIHILESSPTIFPSASARAGGFLAKDWFSSSLADLGILSFELHKTLAERHEGAEKWGYAGSVCMSLITRKTADCLGHDSRPATRGDSWLRQNTSRAELASGTMTPVDSNTTDLTDLPKWLSIASRPQLEIISQPDSTAQIDPGRFCNFLMGECIARGVHLHLSTSATRVLTNPETGAVSALELNTGITLPCSQILVTAGVWTPTVLRTLFPNINHTCPVLNVSSLAGYSIVYNSPYTLSSTTDTNSGTVPDTPPPSAGLREKSLYHAIAPSASAGLKEKSLCHAIFATDENANFSPELFSRHTHGNEQEIYLAGLNTPSLSFPSLAADIQAPQFDEPNIQHLHKVGTQILATCGAGDERLEVVKTQVCHRPVLPDGKPIMGKIPDELLGLEAVKDGGLGGVYVCVGHGPWGIALAPGSGRVMAQMLEGKKTSAHVGLLSVEHAVVQGSPLGSPVAGIL